MNSIKTNFALVKNLDSYIEGEYRPIALENRVLRNIFGPKRDEVRGDLRRLRNEELRLNCSSSYIIKGKL